MVDENLFFSNLLATGRQWWQCARGRSSTRNLGADDGRGDDWIGGTEASEKADTDSVFAIWERGCGVHLISRTGCECVDTRTGLGGSSQHRSTKVDLDVLVVRLSRGTEPWTEWCEALFVLREWPGKDNLSQVTGVAGRRSVVALFTNPLDFDLGVGTSHEFNGNAFLCGRGGRGW